MNCAVHTDVPARATCAICKNALCAACASFQIDGARACESCGAKERRATDRLGSALLAVVAATYLATLALCVLVFKARPLIGGIAVLAAILCGRMLSQRMHKSRIERVPFAPAED